ncbi:MAG: hypothetical protein KJO24_01480, partial [Gammaproteobacteria bacterium]|nr:hypothetical protein [Gammaproteobacteria bacterium]
MLLLTACSSGSKDKLGGAIENCPSVGDLTVEFIQPAFSTSGLCQISGTLTRSAVLSAGVDWRLDGVVQVGDANTNPVLVVEPGATLKGNIESGVVEYLYVLPGASLQAIGTRAQPIIFSSNDENFDLDPGSLNGEWGGVVLEDNLG